MSVEAKGALRGRAGIVIAIAAVGAGISTTGIQGIAPAFPAIQQEFGLNVGQVALVSSVYLFPSIFSAFLGGTLADRFGIRKVFTFALFIFGLGGLALLFVHSFPVLLGIRFFQGAAFGTILAVSMSLIGSVAPSGPAAARGQGQRVVALSVAEAVFPVVTGLLLAISWFAPFAINVLALPVAVASWFFLPNGRHVRDKKAPSMLRSVITTRGFVSLQLLGVLRFVLKFAVVTYFPILAENELGMSPVLVGITLGVSAALTAISAWLSERFVRRWPAARLIAACVVLGSVSVAVVGLVPNVAIVFVAMMVFGFQDGVTSVGQNVLVVEMAPKASRSTFSGATVTLRNVGKFGAPIVFAGAALLLPIGASFVALAGVGGIALFAALRVDRIQRENAAREASEASAEPGSIDGREPSGEQ